MATSSTQSPERQQKSSCCHNLTAGAENPLEQWKILLEKLFQYFLIPKLWIPTASVR